MDPETFDHYAHCDRKLKPSILLHTSLLNPTTRSIPGINKLITRIEIIGLGIKQEIIDYRNVPTGSYATS
jgi:hypothetical protein